MNAGRSHPLVTKILFVRILKDHIGAIARLVLQERITSVLIMMSAVSNQFLAKCTVTVLILLALTCASVNKATLAMDLIVLISTSV